MNRDAHTITTLFDNSVYLKARRGKIANGLVEKDDFDHSILPEELNMCKGVAIRMWIEISFKKFFT
ncbi:hypothetical protein EFM32_09770 [Lactiplantibacillus plantarum]|nr:hypothetical protein SC12_12890 [Lactiplantibacillus plantarum]MCT0221897.1 hypothetical protein [Lactiplantibacillus plantarum]OAH24414.1 hypothetical protein AYJ51_00090 [Lactiplantibacillus plantarum]